MQQKLSAQMISAYHNIVPKPFVPAITNFVTADFVVNCMLAAGASPAVLTVPEECCAAAKTADAFYINLGTILPVYREAIPQVAEELCSLQKKWVLDPVAAGLGELRTEILLELKKYKPSVVRGNASEIITLAKLWQLSECSSSVRGVDSVAEVSEARNAAAKIAKYTGGAVAVSGETDLVTDGVLTVLSYGGSFLMEKVTGCGCALGGFAACCLACATPFIAALCATNAFNAAGRAAAAKSNLPGSFKMCFIDSLYQLTVEEIAHNSFEVLN